MTETRNLLQEYKSGAIEMGEIADIVMDMAPAETIKTLNSLIEHAQPEDNDICCLTLQAVLEDAKKKNLPAYRFSVREVAARYINRVVHEFKDGGRDISELIEAFDPPEKAIFTAKQTRPEPTGRFAIIAQNMRNQ